MISLKSVDAAHWRLEGKLTVDTINTVMKAGQRMFDGLSTGQDIYLDCSGLTKVDSASVALLIEWMRNAKKKQVHLKFENIPDEMQRIIRLSNLQDIVGISH